MTSVHDDALLEQYLDPSMPPNNLLSERILLGAVLWHGPHVLGPVVAEDFYDENHRDLFTLIGGLYDRHPGVPYLDPVAVKDEMFRLGRHGRATDMFCMYDEAITRAVSPLSAAYHAERVLDAAEARMIRQFGQRLARADAARADEITGEMRDAVAAFRARTGSNGDGLRDTQLSELVRMAKLAAATTKPAMSTGLVDLDRILNGGLRPSTFNVLGARPGVGKSLLAGSIASHFGSTGAARVLYVTMELSAAEVTNRILAGKAGIELTRLQNPEQLTDTDLLALDEAEGQIADWPIHIVEGAKTIDQIEDDARLYLGDAPAGLLIVDFLGRIREDGKAASRERHVAMAASRLTDLSRELRIAVLCVVSFSRESVRRGGAPRMDDIRDSGNVESDADTVMLMWAPNAEDPSHIEVVVDKNRYGQIGKVDLVKQGHRGRLVGYHADSRGGGW